MLHSLLSTMNPAPVGPGNGLALVLWNGSLVKLPVQQESITSAWTWTAKIDCGNPSDPIGSTTIVQSHGSWKLEDILAKLPPCKENPREPDAGLPGLTSPWRAWRKIWTWGVSTRGELAGVFVKCSTVAYRWLKGA